MKKNLEIGPEEKIYHYRMAKGGVATQTTILTTLDPFPILTTEKKSKEVGLGK